MAAIGRGRGRGRGLLARETPSEVTPKPSGLASGDGKSAGNCAGRQSPDMQSRTFLTHLQVAENGSEAVVEKSSQFRKESISEISDILDNLKLDVSEQDLKNLQQLAESAIKEDSDVKRLTNLVYEKCISDREFAKTGAYICDKLVAIENKGTIIRSTLLSLIQADFKRKEELHSSSPSKFLNVFSFMCQVFNTMRTAGGEVFKALVTPLFEYINLIADNKDCTADEYESLNIQLQAIGKELELNNKEKMDSLMEKFRTKIIKNGASAQARCTLLELMECYNRGWKELPNDVTRFYCDIMMDIITD